MEYRNLGASGLKVSSLCVGTITWGHTTDQAEADRIFAEALDHGVNFFDTANHYAGGASEQVLGRAVAESGKRDEVVLATKVTEPAGQGVNQRGSSRYHIMQQCERSLKRLRTDRIDLYQLHMMDLTTPVDEALRSLDDLVRQGKVRYIGCSKFVPAYLVEAVMTSRHRGWERFVSEQPPYNLLDRSIENELIWTCLRHGIGIIPWGPLATGILTGQYRTCDRGPAGSRYAGGDPAGMRLNDAAIARVKALEPLAEARGVTLAQFSLAWIHQQPGVTAPILGVRKLDHLRSALPAVEMRLTAEELAEVDRIAPPGSAVSNYWDGNTYSRLRRMIAPEK